jgi:hypothetical protein
LAGEQTSGGGLASPHESDEDEQRRCGRVGH